MTVLWAIVERDVRLGFRSGGGAALSAVFFALVVLIFALAIGPNPNTQSAVAAAAIWAGAVLSTLISFDQLFQADYEDGSLDVLAESTASLEVVIIAKAIAHWITSGLPLLISAPLFGVMLNLPGDAMAPLMASLLIGGPGLSLIGGLVAAATVTLRRANVLVTLLSAPLFTPMLIFGVGAAQSGALDDPRFAPAMMLLAASVLVSLIVAPIAGAAAIRANLG